MEQFYSGKIIPSAQNRLSSAYGKSFSSFDELKALSAPIGLSYINYNMGIVGQNPIVESNKAKLSDRYMTVSGIDSTLINDQQTINNNISNVGEYILNNGFLNEFYPSIRIPN